MAVKKTLILDVNQNNYPQTVFAKQGDIDSREIEILLFDKGVAYTIPSDATARIRLTKPDGKTVINEATILSGKIIVLMTEQMLIKDGIATAEIALYSGKTLLTSQNFYIEIEKSAFDSSAPESSDEYNALNAALIEVQTKTNEASEATTGANNAAIAANNAATAANSAVVAANKVKSLGENQPNVSDADKVGTVNVEIEKLSNETLRFKFSNLKGAYVQPLIYKEKVTFSNSNSVPNNGYFAKTHFSDEDLSVGNHFFAIVSIIPSDDTKTNVYLTIWKIINSQSDESNVLAQLETQVNIKGDKGDIGNRGYGIFHIRVDMGLRDSNPMGTLSRDIVDNKVDGTDFDTIREGDFLIDAQNSFAQVYIKDLIDEKITVRYLGSLKGEDANPIKINGTIGFFGTGTYDFVLREYQNFNYDGKTVYACADIPKPNDKIKGDIVEGAQFVAAYIVKDNGKNVTRVSVFTVTRVYGSSFAFYTDMGAQNLNGKDGTVPNIGENGNWWIGETDTGITAQGDNGDDGLTPFIGENGNWWIGETDTGVKAQGEQGPTGAAIVNTELESVTENGDYVYKQTFDNGAEAYFTAPRGPVGTGGGGAGLRLGQTMERLAFNTKIDTATIADFLSKVQYNIATGMSGANDIALILNLSTGKGVYCVDLSKFGGTGYALSICEAGYAGFTVERIIFVSEYSATNQAIAQNFLPGFTYTAAGWQDASDYTLPANSTITGFAVDTNNQSVSGKVSAFIGEDGQFWDMLDMCDITMTAGKAIQLSNPFTIGYDTPAEQDVVVKFATIISKAVWVSATARFEICDNNYTNNTTQPVGVEISVSPASTTLNVRAYALYGNPEILNNIYISYSAIGAYPLTVDLYYVNTNISYSSIAIKPLYNAFRDSNSSVEYITDNINVGSLPTDRTNIKFTDISTYDAITRAGYDGEGNNIVATYAKKTDTAPNADMLGGKEFTLLTQTANKMRCSFPYRGIVCLWIFADNMWNSVTLCVPYGKNLTYYTSAYFKTNNNNKEFWVTYSSDGPSLILYDETGQIAFPGSVYAKQISTM